MKIVIIGMGKSGTTALYYKIKRSLPPGAICLFEPRVYDPSHDREAGTGESQRPVLAKILPFGREDVRLESFLHFDKKILITRDPRDRVISWILYGLWESPHVGDDLKMSDFAALLRQKEQAPRSVPVIALHAHFLKLLNQPFSPEAWVVGYQRRFVEDAIKVEDRIPGLFVLKYEDFVDGKLEALEGFLGFRLTGSALVDPGHDKITRTKTYGDWRNWFTPEDVDFYRPPFERYIARYGHPADWDLNPTPIIKKEHATLYVLGIINKRRAQDGLPPLIPSWY